MTPKDLVQTNVILNLSQLIQKMQDLHVSDRDLDEISVSLNWKDPAADFGWVENTAEKIINGVAQPTFVRLVEGTEPWAISHAVDYKELCEEMDISPYHDKASEYHAVSEFLGRHLKAQGEKVAFNLFGHTIWARFGSNQTVYGDPCIESIADMINKEATLREIRARF